MSKKLVKNASIYTVTTILNKAVPFFLLPILTTYLSPSDYGIVATFGAFSAIMAIFIQLSMNGAINVNFFKLSKEELRIYIANTLIIIAVTTFIAAIVILFTQDLFIEKLKIPRVWLFVGVYLAFTQFLTAVNLVLWQAEQRAKYFGMYQIMQMLTNTSLTLILVIGLGMKWEGQMIAQAITISLFSILSFYVIYRRNYLLFRFNKGFIEDALKFGIPLIPHALSGWFRTGVDRFFITMLIGTSATGLYSVGYQLGMIVGIVATSFNQAYSPYLYEKLSKIDTNEKKSIVKFTYIYFLSIFLFAGILSILMPWAVTYFLNEKYHSSSDIIPWIAFGYAFQGMYFMVVNYIFFVKKTYILSLITFSTGLLHVILSYLLIKYNGALGAAQATTVSFFIMFVLVWILSAKVYNMPWLLIMKNNIAGKEKS